MMTKFKHFIVSLAVLLSVAATSALAQSEYRFRHFDSKDGLAENFVFTIAQDSLGYMWFQNYNGVTRYDGHNFKVFNRDKDDPRTSMLDFGLGRLMTDENGNVWISKHGHPDRPPFVTVKIDNKSDGFKKYTADFGNIIVGSIAFDRSEPVWLGTFFGKGLIHYNPGTGDTVRYVNNVRSKFGLWAKNSIFDIKDFGSSLLLATAGGLWSFDEVTKTFSRPMCNPRDSGYLFNARLAGFPKKTIKHLWMVELSSEDWTPAAIVQVDENLSIIQKKNFPPGFNLSSIDIDSEGIVWLGTWDNGLYRYDIKDSSFINIRNVPTDPYSLRTNSVSGVFVDRDRNVWVATGKGVSKMYRQTLHPINMPGGGIAGVFKARNNEFIFLSKINGGLPLNSFEITLAPVSSRKLEMSHFRSVTDSRNAISVVACHQGKKYFWVRAYPTGVFGYPINPTTGMIEKTPVHFYPDDLNRNTISTSGIAAIWEDSDEMLWVTGVGLHKVNPKIKYGEKGSVTTYRHVDSDSGSVASDFIYYIYPESKTSFWLLTGAGLDLFHSESEKFEHVVKGSEFVSTLFRSSDGTLFLGTAKGLYQGTVKSGRYSFDGRPLWNRGDVRSIQEDRLGRLWMLTPLGLVCFDRKENIGIEFNDNDYADYVYSLDNHLLKATSQGTLFAATGDGITLFDPTRLSLDRKPTIPLLTNLEVNNKEVVVAPAKTGVEDFVINSNIGLLKEVIIDHKHNNFKIEFAAMEMTSPEKNLYRHKLEGYDDDWIETDFRNRAAGYTNLDAGEYIFKVKASNHHGIWSDAETSLKVKVLPPPWKSNWAYIGYGVVFLGLLYAARRTIIQRERLKSNLKLAKVEQEKEHFELEKAKEVDKAKSTLFANISHEFRTPLTLIKGPVQEMLDEYANNVKVKERMKLVQRNADLVLKLINQLLDLAKLDSGTLSVEKSQCDLNKFLKVVTNSFSSLAFQKNITLELTLPDDRNLVSFDKEKVETILINLINNAIKFTPAGGRVNVRALLNEHKLVLVVSDTGIGIAETQHEKIFERFHQVSESHKEVGTGIGLSLVKELVALMNGAISVKSELAKGSEFTVTLPVEVIRPLTELEDEEKVTAQLVSEEVTSSGNGHESRDNKPHILVVEDNSDLRKFIIGSLGTEFHFLEAADGKEGLQTAIDKTPDLIISDVMMPEMDGITMTGKLKKDARTSHIPLILLTAKTTDESKLSGLSTGADDYLTKPFNKQELLLKVRNSIALQVRLREKFRLELLKDSPKVEVQSADEKFLLKVKETILARLNDEQLSVESLAAEIALSRSQLLRKVTALTGLSVNELIRTFRLQKAAQLLEQHWGPVTQVAYEVGISNLSYFSKAFKEQYGVVPSEYPVKAS